MMRNDSSTMPTDVMPRSLAVTLFVGVIAGSTFWVGLLALVVR